MADAGTDLMNESVFGSNPMLPQTNAPPSNIPEVRPVGAPKTPDVNAVDYLIQKMSQMLRDTAFSAAQPTHNKPHYWSTPLDLSARVLAIPVAAFAPGVWTTAITYVVPPGQRVRITNYGVNVLDPTYSYNGSLLFRIQVNGINKYQDLADWSIQRGTIVQPRSTVMNLVEDDVLTFQVRRELLWAGAPQDVDFCFVGYTWQPRHTFDGSRASIVYTG